MFTLPALPYAYDALEPFIDEQTMHLHHDQHHAAYVKKLNELSPEGDIFSLIKTPGKIANNAGGHLNHSFFWTNLAPSGNFSPQGRLLEKLVTTFGNINTFQDQFTAIALQHFGSGWVWLVMSGPDLKIIETTNQDSPLSLGMTPLLVVDVWEHAYYLKYQNRRADYLAAWWNVVNWTEAMRIYETSNI